MTNEGAVVVWSADQAAKDLTRAIRAKKGGIADLLGADPDTERGRAMIDRFITVALHAATSDMKILRATKESLIQSIRDSALLGLEPVGITGDGAIVVYDESIKKEVPGRHGGSVVVWEKVPTAHFQPMYRGLLKLARRSDQLAHIDAHVVYRGDLIDLDLGSSPSVRHVPVLDGAERGGYVGAYAVAETKEGRRYVEWMTEADIEVVRKSSRGGQAADSPWVKFWPEMARKTVLRRLMKRLPLETMAEHGLRLEAETESAGRTPIGGGSSAPVAELEAPASDARRRLRSRFVADPAEAAPADDGPAVPPVSPPEPTDTAPTGDPAPSGVPTGGEDEAVVIDAPIAGLVLDPDDPELPLQVRGAVCGATSDPQLGAEETCILEPGHAFADRKPSPHESKEGSRWPNR